MALWGNKDSFANLTGTVTVDYANKIITGTGTTFVTAGISTGDVISIGVGNTFGEAVISGVTSATQISIASTQFLKAGATGVAYTVSQKPIYTLQDYSYSNDNDASATLKNLGVTATATTTAGIGTNIIPVAVGSLNVVVGDAIVNNSNNIVITTIGATTISLASTISAGISTGDTIQFRRLTGGYGKDVFGVDQNEVGLAATTAYAVTHSGWVGILTYRDCHGKLRVKNEVLVAGGILTTFDAQDDTFFPE